MSKFSKIAFALVAAPLLLAGAAFAADADAPAGDQFDLAIQAIIASDRMDYGITETNHQPWGQISVTPSYGIFYGNLTFENKDYGPTSNVRSQLKASIGAMPEFGNLSVDFNLQRRWKFDEPLTFRWLPYVTATYKFSDQLSASLGAGYYYYDDASVKSFPELFASVDVTPVEGLALHAETSYDIASTEYDTGLYHDYLEVVGSATVTLPQNFSLVGKVGWENYMSDPADVNYFGSYVWYDAGIDYAVNDHMTFGVHYHGSNLGSDAVATCGNQQWTDCDQRVYAQLTLNGKLSDLNK